MRGETPLVSPIGGGVVNSSLSGPRPAWLDFHWTGSSSPVRLRSPLFAACSPNGQVRTAGCVRKTDNVSAPGSPEEGRDKCPLLLLLLLYIIYIVLLGAMQYSSAFSPEVGIQVNVTVFSYNVMRMSRDVYSISPSLLSLSVWLTPQNHSLQLWWHRQIVTSLCAQHLYILSLTNKTCPKLICLYVFFVCLFLSPPPPLPTPHPQAVHAAVYKIVLMGEMSGNKLMNRLIYSLV